MTTRDSNQDPSGTESPLDAGRDLAERWLPSPEQIAAGVAALNTVAVDERSRFVAVVPLVQPGKQYGIWEVGQVVIPLPGVWLAENTSGETDFPFSKAREAALRVGNSWLRREGLTGTVASVVVEGDGQAAVFEDFMAV